MTPTIYLSTPIMADEEQYNQMINEFKENNEDIIPKAMKLEKNETFKMFIQKKADRDKGKNIPDWYVPNSFFFVKNKNHKIVWGINIRHELNDFLKNFGGHIGYWIKPSERGKWYATQALKLWLEKCKKLWINEIVLMCEKQNIWSAKVIQNNWWRLDWEYIDQNILNQKWLIYLENN